MTDQMRPLFHRQRLLLALLQAFGGRVPGVDFQKYLFLFTTMHEQDKSYEFVPYRFGCFSFHSYADRRKLVEARILFESEDWQIASQADYISQLDESVQEKIYAFVDEYKALKGRDLVRYVYRTYPYFAINSETAEGIMDKQDLAEIERSKPKQSGYKFFTIGYEGQSFENYLNRLIGNNVRVLCDVRKNPLSRKYGFSKSTLKNATDRLGIEYVHIPELGILSEKRQDLETQSDYDRLFDEYEETTLKQNVTALVDLYNIFLQKKRVAITCFEADPCMCHRGRVADILAKRPDWNYAIEHI